MLVMPRGIRVMKFALLIAAGFATTAVPARAEEQRVAQAPATTVPEWTLWLWRTPTTISALG